MRSDRGEEGVQRGEENERFQVSSGLIPNRMEPIYATSKRTSAYAEIQATRDGDSKIRNWSVMKRYRGEMEDGESKLKNQKGGLL
jgi:hypothetical protein